MFLLLPIGAEQDSVRREPWVSYGLIVFNVLVFLLLVLGTDEKSILRDAGGVFEEIVEYLERRPYLEVPPDLAAFLPPDLVEELVAARAQWQERSVPPEEDTLNREREELAALAARFERQIGRLPSHRLGFKPARPHLAGAITSMFIHSGWAHLFGNMLILLLSGPFLEDVFGRPLFGALYLLSGGAAVVGHYLANPGSAVPMVGASGAIAGVMGAFLVRLAASRIRFLFMPLLFVPALRFTFFLPAFVVLPVWFLEQLASARLGVTGVAWWAHIGGFLFGLGVALVVKLIRLEETVINPRIEKEITLLQHPALEVAQEARLQGDLATARRSIRQVLAEQPGNLDALSEAWEIAAASRDPKETGLAATALFEALVRTGENKLASDLIREAPARAQGPLPARFYLAAAGFLEREGDVRSALDFYEALAKAHPDDPGTFRALFRRGEILRKGGDVTGAREAYRRARAHPGCSDALRSTVDRALSDLEGRR